MIHAAKCKTKDVNFAAGNVIPRECDCDGYHTFDELYDHRITLYITLCKHIRDINIFVESDPQRFKVWRSKRHYDGELCFGTGTQYIMGIGTAPGHQITYHIPIERWHETDGIDDYTNAPVPWDGHTSDDVIERLKKL